MIDETQEAVRQSLAGLAGRWRIVQVQQNVGFGGAVRLFPADPSRWSLLVSAATGGAFLQFGDTSLAATFPGFPIPGNETMTNWKYSDYGAFIQQSVYVVNTGPGVDVLAYSIAWE